MSEIKPFRAIRPRVDSVKTFSVSAIDSEKRYKYLEFNKKDHSFLRILAPQVYSEKKLSDAESFEYARQMLSNYEKEGLLIQDETPSFYIYRQLKGNDVFTTIIALASTEEYRNGFIKKHEHTLKDKEAKLVQYLKEVGVSGIPVLLTYPDNPKLDEYVSNVLVEPAPLYHFKSSDGCDHSIWQINQSQQIDYIQELFKEVKCLYIADGHHRSAAMSALYPQVKNFMVSLIPDKYIRIHAFHRYITSLQMDLNAFLDQVGAVFELKKKSYTQFPNPVPGIITLYTNNEWWEITIPQHLKEVKNPSESLDVYILDKMIFEEILKIEDTRESDRVHFVSGANNDEELLKPIHSGKYSALFMLHAVEAEEVMKVSDYGETMPPKSTYIEPKLRSGILVHQFKNLLNL